jgi:DNA-binding transcriptional MerR regulator
MLNKDKDLKLYYSISEVAQIFDVNESLLRFWEKEFPQLEPKKGGRGVRQYRKEDIEVVRLIYHLVKDNKEATLQNFEVVEKLKCIRAELLNMKIALDGFTYEQVEKLEDNVKEESRNGGQ